MRTMYPVSPGNLTRPFGLSGKELLFVRELDCVEHGCRQRSA
ncbi:hypothetical protein [Paenibacillus polymyxa]|nr:hypothetical protein [Paenibacillus polymyxa]